MTIKEIKAKLYKTLKDCNGSGLVINRITGEQIEISIDSLPEIKLPKMGKAIFTVSDESGLTKVFDFYEFEIKDQAEKKITEIDDLSRLFDFMEKQRDWMISYTERSEERFDKRLKELLKSDIVSSQPSTPVHIDWESISSKIPDILKIIKMATSKGGSDD